MSNSDMHGLDLRLQKHCDSVVLCVRVHRDLHDINGELLPVQRLQHLQSLQIIVRDGLRM